MITSGGGLALIKAVILAVVPALTSTTFWTPTSSVITAGSENEQISI